nr:MAG TPA: hypothetical protein [Crassvirales sp.]DAR56565.1 MAG TPA: hypothetical protein [Crassvirales sp.]
MCCISCLFNGSLVLSTSYCCIKSNYLRLSSFVLLSAYLLDSIDLRSFSFLVYYLDKGAT